MFSHYILTFSAGARQLGFVSESSPSPAVLSGVNEEARTPPSSLGLIWPERSQKRAALLLLCCWRLRHMDRPVRGCGLSVGI